MNPYNTSITGESVARQPIVHVGQSSSSSYIEGMLNNLKVRKENRENNKPNHRAFIKKRCK